MTFGSDGIFWLTQQPFPNEMRTKILTEAGVWVGASLLSLLGLLLGPDQL
jgi:hypothetical protein